MTDWNEFCSQGYAALINGLIERGYEARGFHDVDQSSRHVIVRHDVDFSLEDAVRMAGQENELGIISTYFVLMRSEFYNPLSAAGLAALRAITDCRHEIGLHFDGALYAGDDQNLLRAIQLESNLLASALGRPVRTMSFHRPASERIGDTNELAGLINAYGPRFVKDMGYRSDSRGAWRYGHPFDDASIQEGRALQLLVHPFWWSDPAMSPQERLRAFLARRARYLDEELARHCVVHVPQRS